MKSAKKIGFEAKVIAFSNYFQKKEVFPNQLVLKNQSGWEIIPFDQILRCEADSNYSRIFKADGTNLLSCITLKELEKRLTLGKFIRTHQSHLVSVLHIRRIDKQQGITLSDQSIVPVSRRRRNQLFADLILK